MSSRGRTRASGKEEKSQGSGERVCLPSPLDLVTGVWGKLDAVPGFKSLLLPTPGHWLHSGPWRLRGLHVYSHNSRATNFSANTDKVCLPRGRRKLFEKLFVLVTGGRLQPSAARQVHSWLLWET